MGKPKKNTVNVKEISCGSCGKIKKVKEFYVSYNPIHQTGRIPYCKSCLKNMIVDNYGKISLDKVKDALKLIDKPFIYEIWKTSMSNDDIFGTYMKNIQLPQYRYLGWKDSIMNPELENELNYNNINENIFFTLKDFIVDDKIMDKWGYGYNNEEYYYFEKKWNKLIDNYGEKTSLHAEGLITYIRFRVKEELETAKGHLSEAKGWGNLAKDAAIAAKINVSQLSKSDISGGVDLVPQIFEAAESEVGIIPILPKVKEQPYDDADLIIWCNVNYIRRLEDKPRILYKDIWNFYDEMLEEHYKQKGYTREMIKKEKEKRNNVFRDLSEVYKEPVYEESDL
jgi:hypothetical protein